MLGFSATRIHITKFKHESRDFPGGPVAENSPIHLPMQETWVWSLVWEDLTSIAATKPQRTYDGPQLLSYGPGTCAQHQEKPPQREACAPPWRPHTDKSK